MSINLNCTNRIKPKLLREQKTEALLVFVRTTLEDSFKELDEKGPYLLDFSNKEDAEHIYATLKKLLGQLQDHVVSSSYLQSLIQNSGKNMTVNILVQKEKPLMTYYESLIRSINRNLPEGSSWMPEFMVIALLSQWVLEEEKSTNFYPFLKDMDYIDLLERFEKVRIEADDEKKELIMNMYDLSTKLIDSLKKSSFKVVTRKSKKRK